MIAMARGTGKTTYQQMLMNQVTGLRQQIDQDILDSIYAQSMPSYRLKKSWRNRRGELMHRISASGAVREWLETEHSQFGVPRPQWWKFDGKINISDRLFMLLVLKYGLENKD